MVIQGHLHARHRAAQPLIAIQRIATAHAGSSRLHLSHAGCLTMADLPLATFFGRGEQTRRQQITNFRQGFAILAIRAQLAHGNANKRPISGASPPNAAARPTRITRPRCANNWCSRNCATRGLRNCAQASAQARRRHQLPFFLLHIGPEPLLPFVISVMGVMVEIDFFFQRFRFRK